MGNTTSTSMTNMAVNSFVEAASTVAQTSVSTGTCYNDVSLTGCKDVHDIHIDQECYQKIDQQAFQKAVTSSDMENAIDQKISQVAKTIDQNLSLKMNSSQSKAVLNSVTNLATSIKSTIKQNCTTDSFGVNSFSCTNSEGVSDIYVNQKTISEAISKCGQDAEIVESAKNDLKQVIEQYASTVVKNAIGAILFALLGIGLLMMGGETMMAGGLSHAVPKKVLILLLIWAYVWVQCKGWVPFVPNWCEKHRTEGLVVAGSVSGLLFLPDLIKLLKKA